MDKQERKLATILLHEFEGRCVHLRERHNKNPTESFSIGLGTLYHDTGDGWYVNFESAAVYFNLSIVCSVHVCTSNIPPVKITLDYLLHSKLRR